MRQNQLYLIIGALVVVVIALGIYVYREESKPDGVELRIDESGISLEAELSLCPHTPAIAPACGLAALNPTLNRRI